MRRGNPFSVLTRLRAIEERQARASLAHARTAHDRARRRLEEFQEAHAGRPLPAETMLPIELRSLQLRGIRSHEDLLDAAEAHEQSRQRMERKAAEWRRAADDLEAVERLESKRREEAARHARTAAERALEDLHVSLRERDVSP